jgi:hypothetical protein
MTHCWISMDNPVRSLEGNRAFRATVYIDAKPFGDECWGCTEEEAVAAARRMVRHAGGPQRGDELVAAVLKAWDGQATTPMTVGGSGRDPDLGRA